MRRETGILASCQVQVHSEAGRTQDMAKWSRVRIACNAAASAFGEAGLVYAARARSALCADWCCWLDDRQTINVVSHA